MADPTGTTLRVPLDLEQAGAQIYKRSEEITDNLERLRKKLQPILDPAGETDWVGAANNEYGPLQEQWNMAARELFGPGGVMGQITSALNLSWNNYTDCEWANVRTWRPSGG